MKPRVYVILLFLIIPVQATVFNPLSLGDVKPDAGLAALYCIGLLTGPVEAALAGMFLGIVQDLGSASFIGLSGLSRGLVGLFAGILGRHVLDLTSPSNIVFIAAFSLAEAVFIALFLEVFQGSVPFFRLFFSHMIPAALYTGVLGFILLRIVSWRGMQAILKRRSLQKE